MELRLYYAGMERSGRCVRRRATWSSGLWQEIQGGREVGGTTHTRWRVPVGVASNLLLIVFLHETFFSYCSNLYEVSALVTNLCIIERASLKC